MKFIPSSGRILIKPDTTESQTPSGIIIPDNAKEKPMSGIVVSTYSDFTDSCSYKKEERIPYSKYAGTEIEIEGESYLIMQETEIYGKLEY